MNNLTNKKFNRLRVVSRSTKKTSSGNIWWHCKCDCGNMCIVKGSNLVNETIISCGCYRKEVLNKYHFKKTNPYNSIMNNIYRIYKRRAKIYNRKFSLTKEKFFELIKSPCYYCGTQPSNTSKHLNRKKYYVKYNGLDRINSSKGYINTNCVPCCILCNNAKKDYKLPKFVKWVSQTYKHMKLKGMRV